MAARLLSRVAFHLPLSFLTRTSVHQKTPRNVFKNTLLSCSPDVVKLRSQFAALILSRRHQREKTVVIVREGSHRVVTVFFLWSEASLWVPWETPKTAEESAKAQLTPETKPPLRDEKGRFSRKKPAQSGNTEDRTRGIKEWKAKRKLEFQGMVGDWSPPKKRETRLSQAWFKSCFRYTWHQAIP